MTLWPRMTTPKLPASSALGPGNPVRMILERTRQVRLSPTERAQVRTEAAGMYRTASIRAIAATLGRSYGLIRRLLMEAGVELREHKAGMTADWPPEVRKEIARLYSEKGLSMERIAARYSTTHTTIGNVLRGEGVESRKGGRPTSAHDDLATQAIKLFNEGRTNVAEIARELEASYDRVYRRLRGAGLIEHRPRAQGAA